MKLLRYGLLITGILTAWALLTKKKFVPGCTIAYNDDTNKMLLYDGSGKWAPLSIGQYDALLDRVYEQSQRLYLIVGFTGAQSDEILAAVKRDLEFENISDYDITVLPCSELKQYLYAELNS